MNLFCWGSSDKGQLGNVDAHLSEISKPSLMSKISSSSVEKVSCGFDFSLFLLENGKVYSCGSNEYQQLGHRMLENKPTQVQMLDDHKVIDISTGQYHSAAVTNTGKIFTWGRNAYGELGRDKPDDCGIKLVSGLSSHYIVQVSCGADHTLALTNTSDLFAWGSNDRGQLGLCYKSDSIGVLQKVTSLNNLPIKQIRASEKFSIILTPSGLMYSWGWNEHGQLGRDVSKSEDEWIPMLIKHLKTQPIAYISTGQNHVAALSMDGGVFTWGFGRFGQLGHSNFENKSTPCKVADLMGSIVDQIECGMNHTLAHISSTGIVYAFGLGANGQLGTGSIEDKYHTPRPIKGPWVSTNQDATSRISRQLSLGGIANHVVVRIFAGGNHSMMVAEDISNQTHRKSDVIDLRSWNWQHPSTIAVVHNNDSKDLQTKSSILFSSLACLSACFYDDIKIKEHISRTYHGVNIDLANQTLSDFFETQSRDDLFKITYNLKKYVFSQTQTNYPSLECLRFFLIIAVSSILERSDCRDIVIPFCISFIQIHDIPATAVNQWIGMLKPRYFKKFCMVFMTILNERIDKFESLNNMRRGVSDLIDLKPVFDCLRRLHQINEQCHRIIHYNTFYSSKLMKVFDLAREYECWLRNSMSKTDFSIFNYPFLFDGIAKANIIKIEAKCMMSDCPRFFVMFGIPFEIGATPASYHITVRRENLLGDTLMQLQSASQHNLKKPLRVNFYGEDALDEGGVMKELFLLIVPQILNPDYGLFEINPDSRLCWFHQMTFEDDLPQYNAIGRLFGLAIYNNVMIDLHFPLVMFKKLLNEQPNLDDLIELNPTLGKSLQQLLDYEGSDFEDTFVINFIISMECYGEQRDVELIPGGTKVPVTLENRQEYVDLYIDYILNKNVQQPFEKFREGFHFTMHGQCVNFFKPIELQELMVGSENFNWNDLRKSCSYLGEYWNNHPIINWFWNCFFALTLEDKKKFLRFLTGCDRVPIDGMSDIKIKIQPVNVDDSHLPAAHTCYNLLDLPKYSSESVLRQRLKTAIEFNEGFALV